MKYTNEITSVNNKIIKELYQLKISKNGKKFDRFLVESKTIIENLYKDKILSMIICTRDNYKYYSKFIDVEVLLVSRTVIHKLSNAISNKGFIGVGRKIINTSVDLSKLNKIILLDGINDPKNFGHIIRCAYGFNYETVVLVNNHINKYNPKVLKSSTGLSVRFNVVNVDTKDIQHIGVDNFYLFMIGGDSMDLKDVTYSKKHALVFGNESQGISKELFNIIDNKQSVFIKINKNLDSLNLGASAAIAMFKGQK